MLGRQQKKRPAGAFMPFTGQAHLVQQRLNILNPDRIQKIIALSNKQANPIRTRFCTHGQVEVIQIFISPSTTTQGFVVLKASPKPFLLSRIDLECGWIFQRVITQGDRRLIVPQATDKSGNQVMQNRQ